MTKTHSRRFQKAQSQVDIMRINQIAKLNDIDFNKVERTEEHTTEHQTLRTI